MPFLGATSFWVKLSMRKFENKLVSIADLKSLCEDLKQKNKKIISTNGCFDLLHLGHLEYLEKARELGDVLICAINSDASVQRLKGPQRPIQTEGTRAKQLAALESVDYVVIFQEDTPSEVLLKIHPDIHVKGGDYSPDELPEKTVVEAGGGRVLCVPLTPGFSTTELIRKIKT